MKRLFIIPIFILFTASLSFGFPVNPHKIKTMEINGEQLQVRQWGDEWQHGWETIDGFSIIQNRTDQKWYYASCDDEGRLILSDLLVGINDPEKMNLERHLRNSSEFMESLQSKRNFHKIKNMNKRTEQSQGDWKVLAIFIEYKDQPFIHDTDVFQELLFSENPDDPRSMTDYYNEVSYGMLLVELQDGTQQRITEHIMVLTAVIMVWTT